MAYLAKWMRRCLFICFFAVFLMSHNASAIELTQEVNLIRGSFKSQIMTDYWNSISCSTSPTAGVYVNELSCPVGVLRLYNLFITIPERNYNDGDWIVFQFEVWTPNGVNQNFSNFTGISYGGIHPVDVVDVEVESLDNFSGLITVYTRVWGSFSDNNLKFVGAQGVNGIFDLVSTTGSTGAFIRPSTTTVWHSTSVNTQGIIDAINNQPNYTQNLNNINNGINDVKNSIDNQNEEEKQETQDASDDAAAEVGEVADNAATSNLIGIISNFISAISDFTGGNCNLSLAFPSYAGGTLNVNVCQNKDKAGNIIEVFTSLTLIVFYLPLALKLLSMIYNEIRSFTNG